MLSVRKPRFDGSSVVIPVCGTIHIRIDDPVVTLPPSPNDEATLDASDIDDVFRQVRDILLRHGIEGVQLRSRPSHIWVEGSRHDLSFDEQELIARFINEDASPREVAMVEYSEVRGLALH